MLLINALEKTKLVSKTLIYVLFIMHFDIAFFRSIHIKKLKRIKIENLAIELIH